METYDLKKQAALQKLLQYKEELGRLFELGLQLTRNIHKLEQLHVQDLHDAIEGGYPSTIEPVLDELIKHTGLRWYNDLLDLTERLKYNNRLQIERK